MTIEEAKTFLDNLKVCVKEHPIVADWLVEIADRKTEPTSSILEQVDKDINVRSKTEPQTSGAPYKIDTSSVCKTEPQPCEWCKFYDGENCYSQEPCRVMLYLKTEPQTGCADTNLSEKPTDSERSE